MVAFSLPSIIIVTTFSEPWRKSRANKSKKKSKQKASKQNWSKPTNHSPQTRAFESVEARICFLRVPLRLLTEAKNASVGWAEFACYWKSVSFEVKLLLIEFAVSNFNRKLLYPKRLPVTPETHGRFSGNSCIFLYLLKVENVFERFFRGRFSSCYLPLKFFWKKAGNSNIR